MSVVKRDLRRRCEAPSCVEYAVLEVNLASMAAYMAKVVCEDHVTWAEEYLRQYLPTDR